MAGITDREKAFEERKGARIEKETKEEREVK
jgi:hypothetical protein